MLGRFRKPLEACVFVELPLLFLGVYLLWLAHQGLLAVDAMHAFRDAAGAVIHGRSPFTDSRAVLDSGHAYVYPPLVAFLAAPTLLGPVGAMAWVVSLLMIGLVLLALGLLEVRDWRCYGIVFAWLPTISAVQTGNVSIPILVATAMAWRYRHRLAGPFVLGVSLAAKPLVWPLAFWLIARRRLRGFAVTLGVAGAFLLLPWAALGFAGVGTFWRATRTITSLEAARGYSFAMALRVGHIGHPELAGALVGIVVLFVGLAVARSDEARGFSLMVLASLVLAPVLWIHYLVLLVVPAALRNARLHIGWALPIILWVVPAHGSSGAASAGDAWRVLLTLSVATICCTLPSRTGIRATPAASAA
jgi:Glycosyltransferase family 87